MTACIFCDREKIKHDILFESEHFFIKVAIAMITPGHLLIIPKQHRDCFGDLSPELQPEFEALKEKIHSLVQEQFFTPFWIEYGPGRQSVPHAHIHCIPLQGEGYALQSFVKTIEPDFPLEDGSWENIRKIRGQGLSYIHIEEQGQKYLFPFEISTKGNQRFHYRRFFSRRKGVAGLADWTTLTDEEWKDDERKRQLTKEKLAPR